MKLILLKTESLQMFQSVAVGVLNKCDLRSGQTQKSSGENPRDAQPKPKPKAE